MSRGFFDGLTVIFGMLATTVIVALELLKGQAVIMQIIGGVLVTLLILAYITTARQLRSTAQRKKLEVR